MALFFGHALPYMATNNDGNLYAELLPADQRVEAASGTQEVADGCLDSRVVDLRSRVEEQLNANLLFNSSMAGATGSVLPTNWASGSVSGLTYTISSASAVAGFQAIEWTVSGTALSDGDIYLACEPMQSGSVVAQIPSEYVGSMYCAKVSGTIKAAMVLQTLTQNFVDGAVQETKTKDLAAVTGTTFVRIEPNSVKTDIDLENRVNLRLYQPISSGEAVDFTIRVAAPQVEAGFAASPFISTVSGAVSEVRGRPSILVVPQLTKAGVVYPQIPVVSGADFTFTRATTATRVNASGLIESVASGVLRLDYPIGGGCPAALIEPAAINLALHSRDLTNAVWTGTNINTAKNAVGADGVASGATTLTATAASGTILQSTSHLQFARVFSAYVRRVTGTGAIQMTVNGGTNWDTVTISSAYTQVASAIRSIPSGTVGFRMAVSGDVIEVDFTQYEATNVTSPIPTTTASATRNADVCSVSGVSGYIGQTQGTIYAEVLDVDTLDNPIFSVDDGTNNNRILIYRTPTTGLWNIFSASNGVNTLGSGTVSSNNGKLALAYSSSGIILYRNGVQVATSSGALPLSFSAIRLNGRVTNDLYSTKRLRAFAIYTTRLSNDQLESLTRLT